MKWLIDLIVGLFKSIFQVNMENPIKESEEMYDYAETSFEHPDDVFSDSDWH